MALPVWLAVLVLGLAWQLPQGAANNHSPPPAAGAPTSVPFAYGIFDVKFNITSKSREAIRFFNLGLLLTADFNQVEARRAFRAALSYDKTCAMCWWGIAYSRGPYQNKPAIQPPNNAPPGLLYYSQKDREMAVKAINYAAALLGLVSLNNVSKQANASAAALQERASGQEPTSVRLVRRLSYCRPSGGAGGSAAAGGSTGRRQLLHSHLRPPPSPSVEPPMGPDMPPLPGFPANPDSPRAPLRPPAPPHMSQLVRERHYVAAMFDRLSVRELWGEKWAQAEMRYARDMKRIGDCNFADADALAMAAEALANLTPWDFVEPETGKPKNTTRQILGVLDRALARDADHPLALHLKIHVTEAFPPGKGTGTAGEGTAAADALQRLVAVQDLNLDHLHHMPSHNYVRVGRWQDAVLSNLASLRASVRVSRKNMTTYYPEHNTAMLVFAASMGADLPFADTYARVLRELPRFVRDAPASLGYQWTAPLLVWSRFGVFSLVLKSPPPLIDPESDAAELLASAWEKQEADQKAGMYDRLRTASGGRGVGQDVGESLSPPYTDIATEGSLDGVLRSNPGPLRGRLGPADYSQDGAEYAAVVWLFSRFLALANLYDNARALAGDPRPPPPSPPPPFKAPAPPSPSVTDQQAAAMGAQAGMFDAGIGGGGGDEASHAAAWELIRQVGSELNETYGLLRDAVALVPPDVAVPPGPGLGVVIPGYELMAKVHMMMADARMSILAGRLAEAAAYLEAATKVEDGGGYIEPPRVGMQPVRQCLGAVQMRQGKVQDMLKTLLDDLARHPENPWSLTGLQKAVQVAEARIRGESIEPLLRDDGSKAPALATDADSGEPLSPLQGQELADLQKLVAAANAALASASEANKDAMNQVPNSCPAFFLPRRSRR